MRNNVTDKEKDYKKKKEHARKNDHVRDVNDVTTITRNHAWWENEDINVVVTTGIGELNFFSILFLLCD